MTQPGPPSGDEWVLAGRLPFVETNTRSYQDHHLNTTPAPLRALRAEVPSTVDDLVLAMLAKRPADRPTAEAVYDALLPLARTGAGPDLLGDRDPRRPFLRPLAPTPRTRRPSPPPRPAAPARPLTVDEALGIHAGVAQLVQESQLQQAIDLLDDAVRRGDDNPILQLEMKVELATTLYMADEFTRAAAVIDSLASKLDGRDDAPLLRYYAGISHAEIGEIDPAVRYLTAFLAEAEPGDYLYRDATYQLGIMLPAVGRADEGLRYLTELRPLLAAEYGPDSVILAKLDQRIAQVRMRQRS